MPIIHNFINPPERILLGSGPSNVHPRVRTAMSAPTVGHLDPYFFSVMDETVNLLRYLFQTENMLSIPMSGTGSSGMETSLCNFLELGDIAVIGVHGLFGERMVDCAQRCGAEVKRVDAEWGSAIDPAVVESTLKGQKKVKLIALVHAETSTGVLQPLAEISKLAKQYETLFLVDTVTSLAGHEVTVDRWGIDICFGGTQKCISCPPGLAPFTANNKALDVLKSRKNKVQSWYLDLSQISAYWSGDRFYHHTAPINMIYGFHEALALIEEEGLEARIKRHFENGSALQAGLEAMGLVLHADKEHRLKSLTSVRVPEKVDELRIRKRLLNEYNIEISGGLGPLKGKIWRIGMMGYSSKREHVLLLLTALETLLIEEGFVAKSGEGVAAAIASYGRNF